MAPWAGIVNRAFTKDTVGPYLRSLPRPTFVRFVVVHNTGSPSLAVYRGYAKRAKPISDNQWLRNLEGYYRDQQHWKAGPHWFVTPNDAGLLAFTPSTIPGTHSPSWNSQSLGVEMVGDYQSEPFDGSVRQNVIALLAEMHLWLGLDPRTIRFHREDTRTTHKDCPGKNVDKARLIADVRAKMNEIEGRVANVEAVKAVADLPVDMPADTDAEPEQVAAPVKTGRTLGWLSSIGGSLGFLAYLTDWRIVAVLLGGLFVIGVTITLFMGPSDVRAWIKRQVS